MQETMYIYKDSMYEKKNLLSFENGFDFDLINYPIDDLNAIWNNFFFCSMNTHKQYYASIHRKIWSQPEEMWVDNFSPWKVCLYVRYAHVKGRMKMQKC